MKHNQRRVSRLTALAMTAFALVGFALLTPSRAQADPIAITGGSYTLSSPFRTVPRYISFSHDLQGNNVRILGGAGDSTSQQLGSNCPLPCTAGATFSLNGTRRLGRDAPTGILELGGQTHTGFFMGPGEWPRFVTDSVTIPLNAGAELTLSTFFSMSGSFNFLEYDLQNASFTGFSYSEDIFGAGIANISLFFSQTTRQYEVSSVRYEFQPEPVPEPTTLLLLGSGLAGIAAKGYKRKRARGQTCAPKAELSKPAIRCLSAMLA